MPSRVVLVMVLAALAGVWAPRAGGQGQPPPCPAGVAAQPTFTPTDLDEFGSNSLVATHTIQVTTDFGSTSVNNPAQSVPPPATTVPPHGNVSGGPGGVVFYSDTPGSVAATETWTQDDGSGAACAGSAATSFQLQPSTPLPRLIDIKAAEHLHPNLKYEQDWSYGTGTRKLSASADLDPVQVMARGISKPRLPGANVPFKTITVPLRVGDPGFSGVRQFHLKLPRWTISAGGDHSAFGLKGNSRVGSIHDKALGYEVKVMQSGRLLAHFRFAGKCNSTICSMRIHKVQLF